MNTLGTASNIHKAVVEALNAWNAEHTREGFRRGAMIEALHIVRCDVPEEFHGPYMPVTR